VTADAAVAEVLTADGPTAAAVATAQARLAEIAPDLLAGFEAALPRAADVVARRLFGAAYREGLIDAPPAWSGGRVFVPRPESGYHVVHTEAHAFDRLEVVDELITDPAALLGTLCPEVDPDALDRVAAELADATVGLALALARRERADDAYRSQARSLGARDSLDLATASAGADATAGSGHGRPGEGRQGVPDADQVCLFFERLATEGHNLHPCGRTRLGWRVDDLLAHDLESPASQVALVAVRREVHLGDDVGADLARHHPEWVVGLDRHRYAATPVHVWQRDQVIRPRYPELIEDGSLILLEHTELPAYPTSSLRTVLLPPDGTGTRRYLKLSLDIQVTSTRRGISAASAHNGPVMTGVLGRLLDDVGEGRFLLMAEPAGSAFLAPGGSMRDLSAIVRTGLTGRLEPGEIPVPALALPARSPVTGTTVLAELVDRYAAELGVGSARDAALDFLDEYARLLLPPLLQLATRHGIALEAHLQNCIPTFVGGVPHRMAVRDFAGLRVHLPRLNPEPPLWPGSAIVTEDVDLMRAKLGYTAFQAHLGELVLSLAGSHDLSERAAWSVVRSVIDEVYADLAAQSGIAHRAVADHAFLTAPTVPHKALLRMRLDDRGDIYLPVDNPLRAAESVLP
jgi:D-ornithine---citrate ligase